MSPVTQQPDPIQELRERIEILEKYRTESKILETGTRKGQVTILVPETKELVETPTITIPRTGLWELGLTIRGYQNVAGLIERIAGPSINGGGIFNLYNFTQNEQFSLSETTNFAEPFNLNAGDVITVKAATFQAGSCTFDLARLLARQIV